MTKPEPASLHPSGLTWERWNWPLKTEAERMMVARYYRKTRLSTFDQAMQDVGPALL